MTYNTGNPVPSTDPRDLDDSAQAFDRFMHSSATTEPDRLGVARLTWSYVEAAASALTNPNVIGLAALTSAAGKAFRFTGNAGQMATYDISALGLTLANIANQAAGREAIGALGASDNIATASRLATARTIAATGDAAWVVSFTGSADVSAVLTLASTGVPAGTYGSVTVNAKGLVTAASAITPVANGGTGQSTLAAAQAALAAAAVGPEFTSFALQNSWVVATGRRAVYRKYNGKIDVEFNVSGGTATDNTVMATLPVDFRPPFPIVTPVVAGPNTTPAIGTVVPRAIIGTDGTIQCINCTNTTLGFIISFNLE